MNFFKSKEFLTFLSVVLVTFIIGLTAVYAGEREDAIKDFARDLNKLQQTLEPHTPVTPVKPTESPEFLKKANQMFGPSVQLINETAKGFCSGTIIGSKPKGDGKFENLIYTARHCGKGMKDKITVDFHGKRAPATVYARAKDNDTMLLVLESPVQLPVAKLATEEDAANLYFSQKAYNSSFPLSGTMTYSEGFLAFGEAVGEVSAEKGKKSIPLKYNMFKTNITMAPGSSGSCLFVENIQGDYVCIGTATAIRMPFFYLGYFTPSNFVTDLLNGS